MKLFSFIIYLLIFPELISTNNTDKIDSSTNWKYELEGVNVGTDGTYLVKIWVYSKKSELDFNLAKKMAIHGVIFKGVAIGKSLSSQPPLTSNMNLEEEKKDFFKAFFSDGGDYLKFINASSDQIAAGDRLKIGKEYKIGTIVSINKDALRLYLENAGIIKKLSDGF